MSALVRRETIRSVTVTAEVTARVRLDRTVSDSQVREALDMPETEDVTEDQIQEYLLENSDDSEWEVLDFVDWGLTFDTEVNSEKSEMVAPPTFVALPGMEGL